MKVCKVVNRLELVASVRNVYPPHPNLAVVFDGKVCNHGVLKRDGMHGSLGSKELLRKGQPVAIGKT